MFTFNICTYNEIIIDRLQDKKQEETDNKFFTEMPSPHFMEITQLLLKWLVAVAYVKYECFWLKQEWKIFYTIGRSFRDGCPISLS